jgi:nitrous oxidase accessory protein
VTGGSPTVRPPAAAERRAFAAIALAGAAALTLAGARATGATGPPGVLSVGPEGGFATIGAALEAAGPGDTVRVAPGVYRERLRVEGPVVLVGEGRPVVDAGGEGHVVEAQGGLEIRGFHLRGSGTRTDAEHAGVMVRDGRAVVEDNVLTDVYYGVYLKNAGGSRVRGNHIEGKDLPAARRGDGIRLWHSSGTRVLDNRVHRTRDVVVYFSDDLSIRGNVITAGRYGLHYMYSDHNEFRRNYFSGNQVGAFIMYSTDVSLRGNVFAESRGSSGMGLGLKDADSISAVDNLFVENRSGIYFDNAPRSAGVVNRIADNVFLFNGSGVRMLPSVAGNEFDGNAFVGNDRPARVSGGMGREQVLQNGWDGNYWSGYAGFDRDGDGVGDSPYRYARLTDDLLAEYPGLQFFDRSPVMTVVEAVRRFFPLLEPEPVVVDSAPRLRSDALRRWRASPPVSRPEALPGQDPAPASGRGADR